MITEDYVSFETAKLLKEKGFREICNKCYGIESKKFFSSIRSNDDDTMYAAPTLQMTMKWLREVHKIDIDITSRWNLTPEYHICEYRYRLHYSNAPSHDINQKFNTYEEACEAAIKYCLENLI
jgi:hypothetical protein